MRKCLHNYFVIVTRKQDCTVFVPSLDSTLLGKKGWEKFFSGKNFVVEKFSHFWKISDFSPTNFSSSSLVPDQFLKLKGLSWVGLHFFQRKVVLLVWDFSNWRGGVHCWCHSSIELGVANTLLRWYHETKIFCTS